MTTVLHILVTLIWIVACVVLVVVLGAIGIAMWLFHTWDEAERKYEVR